MLGFFAFIAEREYQRTWLCVESNNRPLQLPLIRKRGYFLILEQSFLLYFFNEPNHFRYLTHCFEGNYLVQRGVKI